MIRQRMTQVIPGRILAKIQFTDNEDDCWEWLGAKNPAGYGHVYYHSNGIKIGGGYAHRVIWYLMNNTSLIDGDCILHQCDNPKCVNPNHLFVGTSSDNTRDMVRKGRHFTPRLQGEKHGRAKLTTEQVKAIREDRRSVSSIAKDFKVRPNQIIRIKKKLQWKHV